jgi:AcrR family transcriptional regulator
MEEARARILQTALKLFSTYGYAGTTTREIARGAGVAEVTLFRHFPTKERLFQDVVAAYLPGPDFRELVAAARKLEYRHALESIAAAFLDALRERQDLVLIMYMESRRHFALMERVYAALVADLTALIAGYFRDLQEQGLIRPLHPTAAAMALLGLCLTYYESQELFPNRGMAGISPPQLMGEFIDIFLAGTKGRPSPASPELNPRRE